MPRIFSPTSLARVEVVLNSVKVRDERGKTKSDIFGVIYVNLDAVVRGGTVGKHSGLDN